MDNCVFCKIIKGELPSLKIDENDDVIVFLALEGHPLIVPKMHIKDIYALDDVTGAAIMKSAIKISKAVKKGLKCEGINLIQANEPAGQQDVFHFHLHIKPRWIKDTVVLKWDTEISEDQRKEMAEKIKKVL